MPWMLPFRLPDGLITRDAYKAMLLQLDPNDDEAEQRIRMTIENTSRNELANALRKQLNGAIPPGATNEQILAAADNMAQNSGPVRDVLRRMLQRSADLGVNVAIDQFDRIGFGFDWTLANQHAAEWAEREVGQLISNINTTTQRRVQTAVSEWTSNGDPLSKLRDELAPIFGDKRADLIASTEVTRAYAEGNRIAYRDSGVVEQIEWRTAADELVCPICGPLAGKRDVLDGDFGGVGIPPAHPRCRCWIVPVVA